MSNTTTLPQLIQGLLDQRDVHTKAIAGIDATLARVNAALSSGNGALPAKPASIPKARIATPQPAGAKETVGDGKTGNEFVLGFIKSHDNATSQQINAAWKASGRNRTADITLSLLTKAKKLKRTALGKGKRGSTYSVV